MTNLHHLFTLMSLQPVKLRDILNKPNNIYFPPYLLKESRMTFATIRRQTTGDVSSRFVWRIHLVPCCRDYICQAKKPATTLLPKLYADGKETLESPQAVSCGRRLAFHAVQPLPAAETQSGRRAVSLNCMRHAPHQ